MNSNVLPLIKGRRRGASKGDETGERMVVVAKQLAGGVVTGGGELTQLAEELPVMQQVEELSVLVKRP